MDPILQTIILYLIVIIILLFTLTIHELGHFFAAKIFNVHVKEFSIGIGPKIFSKITKRDKTKISLRLFPIMAYVLMDSKSLRDAYKDEINDKNYAWYMQKPPKGKNLLDQTKTWQYLLIMFAGVFVNFIFFLIFWPVTMAIFNFCSTETAQYIFVNPFIQLAQSFEAIWYNCIFDLNHASGSIFGEIVQGGQSINWVLTMLNYLLIINLLSVILNLIPLPPLDGYKIVSNLYTKITKKQINEKVETALMILTIVLMLYILIASIVVDILKSNQQSIDNILQILG